MAEPAEELRIEPARVGQVLECHLPAWRQSENVYVHAASVALDRKNNPKLTVHASCSLTVTGRAKR